MAHTYETPRTLQQIITQVRTVARDPGALTVLMRIEDLTTLCDAALCDPEQPPREEDTFGGPRPKLVT